MSRKYDRPLIIQRINEATEQWEDAYVVHSYVNKSATDNRFLNAGAIQGKRTLTFEIRYFSDLEDVSYRLSSYRLIYQGIPFAIQDYDDYMLKHKTVKIVGESSL